MSNIKQTDSLDELSHKIRSTGYIADPALVTSLHLMNTLQKPLLVEGEAGVGKTGIAECLARAYDCELVRLQCYEGLDASQALYDWDYQRQLLHIQMAAPGRSAGDLHSSEADNLSRVASNIYSEDYLLRRPLLKSIAASSPVVLLIDEIDRADEEFEALLLEVLSDFQISIPEMGVFKALSLPRVILTSNGVRELSDALRRRCLYHYMDFPDRRKELSIVQSRLPNINQNLAAVIVNFVQTLRGESLRKTPGIAETLDWAAALLALNINTLDDDAQTLESTLPALLKTRADQLRFKDLAEFERLLEIARNDQPTVNND